MHRRRWGIFVVVAMTAGLPLLAGGCWLRSYWPAQFFLFSREGRLTFIWAEGNRAAGLANSENDWGRQLASLRSDARTQFNAAGLEFAAGPIAAAPNPATGPSVNGGAPPGFSSAANTRGAGGAGGGASANGGFGPGGFAGGFTPFAARIRSGEFRMIGMSYAYPFAVSLIAFAVVVIAIRRRAAAGHCTHCGYDMRATPDRCPECGSVASKSL